VASICSDGDSPDDWFPIIDPELHRTPPHRTPSPHHRTPPQPSPPAVQIPASISVKKGDGKVTVEFDDQGWMLFMQNQDTNKEIGKKFAEAEKGEENPTDGVLKLNIPKKKKGKDVKQKCSICGKAFKIYTKMVQHMKSSHGDEGRWACETCGKTYGSKSYLENIHMPTHMGPKNKPKGPIKYKCSHCPLTFDAVWKVGQHKQLAHKGVAGNIICKYRGNGCKKTYNSHGGMAAHASNCPHRPGATRSYCPFTGCEKDYGRPSDLHAHMKKAHNWVKGQKPT
jgi:hypothetical protein